MRKIKNFERLAITETRKVALEIIEAGLEAIDTEKIIHQSVKLEKETLTINDLQIDLKNKNLYICGIGKCAYKAAASLENILGSQIKGGIVMGVEPGSLKYLKYIQGTHPLPSETNTRGTNELLKFAKERGEKDLILTIISGGGSALLTCHNTLTCADESLLTQTMFQNGANIKEMNILRKHLSLARGGNLAATAHPAQVISLIFSDVPTNDISLIASAPTVLDTTTKQDAITIVEKYNLDRCCGLVKDLILETPKDKSLFAKTTNLLLLTNETALKAMQNTARAHGWNAEIISKEKTGEVSSVLDDIIFDLRAAVPKTVLLYGGETTMKGDLQGDGGRNQELAMRAATHIDEGELIIALASDGRDHSDIAGAIADSTVLKIIQDKQIDLRSFLKLHSASNFAQETSTDIITGDTGSNISDLIIAMKE